MTAPRDRPPIPLHCPACGWRTQAAFARCQKCGERLEREVQETKPTAAGSVTLDQGPP